jgi:hypothetical protein
MDPEPRPCFTEVRTAYKTLNNFFVHAEFVGVMNCTFKILNGRCFI